MVGGGRTVQLRIGGQTYRVVTSASDDELQRLTAMVEEKLALVSPPGRPINPHAMLLAALALAHELHEERNRNTERVARTKSAFTRMLQRVDAALGNLEPERRGPEGAGGEGSR
jgi:cell division protein ZapA